MPRYYRRRYTRVVRPKKKWASNIITWSRNSLPDSHGIVLVANSAQAASPTPSILKTGNFKVSADLALFYETGGVSNLTPGAIAYILYVPEGWQLTEGAFVNLVEKHPEWIMATKTMGGSVTTGNATYFSVDTLNMSTKLKRNLNSGDQVVLYFQLNSTSFQTVTITGTCRYWTCSN